MTTMARYEADTIDEVKPVAAAAEAPPLAVLEYDVPPPQWVPGTVVPQDTLPEDMTDAEYVQWCFDNKMPYWAIKKEIVLRNPPILSALNPSTAAIGDESFVLYVSGENFVEGHSVIVFAGHDEPTTLNEDGTLSTGVNMGVWHGPDVLPVMVRNGGRYSEPLEFTFTGDAPAAAAADADADYDDDGFGDDDGKPAKKSKKKK
jgi:hypothetical protein